MATAYHVGRHGVCQRIRATQETDTSLLAYAIEYVQEEARRLNASEVRDVQRGVREWVTRMTDEAMDAYEEGAR